MEGDKIKLIWSAVWKLIITSTRERKKKGLVRVREAKRLLGIPSGRGLSIFFTQCLGGGGTKSGHIFNYVVYNFGYLSVNFTFVLEYNRTKKK